MERESGPMLEGDNEEYNEEYLESLDLSVDDGIDRMRDEGGIAPEIPHSEVRANEIQQQWHQHPSLVPKETTTGEEDK